MKDIVLFDHMIVRVKQSIFLIAFLLTIGAVNLNLLHVSHDWVDRITFISLLIVAFNRPAAYFAGDGGDKKDGNSPNLTTGS